MVTLPPQLSVAVGVPTGGIGSLQAIVIFDGTVIAGLPLSTTVMRCEMDSVLLQLSAATHRRVKVYAFGHAPLVLVWPMYVMATSTSQLSVAVGNVGLGMASHCTVTLAGGFTNAGFWVSMTVMRCVAVRVLPQG